jgi:transposase
MTPDPQLRIFVCATPTSMTYSFDRLMARAKAIFDQDPFAGHLFLFFNAARDRVKVLFWDTDGFCIWYKRLEAGTFQMPDCPDGQGGVELDAAQMARLLGGLDLDTGRRRRRYWRPKPPGEQA